MRLATFLILGAIALSAGPAAADLCLPGFYGVGGTTPCFPCESGTYGPTEGLESCLACEAGTYANFTASVACNVCDEGFIAPNPGSILCQECPSGTTSNESHTACEPISVPVEPHSWGLLKAKYAREKSVATDQGKVAMDLDAIANLFKSL